MIEVKYTKVGDLEVNCCVITDSTTKKTAVIDPGEVSEFLDYIISEIGYDNVEYVLLTHGHFDHVDGANDIVKKTNGKAKIAIHEDDVKLLADNHLNLSIPFTGKPLKSAVNPDILLKDGSEITLGESTIKVMHTPGHSPGSVCFICDEYIFSGDTLFCMAAGRTDFPLSNNRKMMQSLKKIANLEGDYKVYPGHNDITTLDYERMNNPYYR